MKKLLIIAWLVFLGWACWNTYQPFMAGVRPWMGMIWVAHILIMSFLLIRRHREEPNGRRGDPASGLLRFTRNDCAFFISLLFFDTTIWLHQCYQQEKTKERVLLAKPEQLHEFGQRFIVGYRNFEEIKNLVKRGAIGGVYITRRNIRGKTFDKIRTEIETLQAIQKENGHSPLVIAADQEGGIVSHLSPLLTALPPLSEIIKNKDGEILKSAVEDYADTQGKELSELGINLNLGPVVDLKENLPEFKDSHSLISQRAISSDPEVISEVASIYCNALFKKGVLTTLKHFPGLGSVKGDSHFQTLNTPVDLETLNQQDWYPFKKTTQDCKTAAIMVSHVIVPEIDSENPASVSRKVIWDVMRKKLNFEVPIITDDFSMGPIVSRAGGVGKASLDALNAGVDSILISYDSDLYYLAMDYLLKYSEKNDYIALHPLVPSRSQIAGQPGLQCSRIARSGDSCIYLGN